MIDAHYNPVEVLYTPSSLTPHLKAFCCLLLVSKISML